MLRTFLCCIIFFTAFSVIAGTRHPDVSDEEIVKYGNNFIHTVIIVGHTNDNKTFIGSGVAISKNIVLTAAHVIHNAKDGMVSIPYQKKAWKIEHAILHSDFELKNFGEYDIAILVLSGDMNFKWYPSLYEETNELDKVCSLSGYGATGTFETGISKELKPKLRAGSNIVTSKFKHLLICDASKKKETELEYLINIGDSGGPLYIENKIAGIHSGVIASDGEANGGYGDQSGHTRVSLYRDWIKRNMEPHLDKER